MGEYFKPWRRKVGLLTLLLACLFLLGWVRASMIEDCFVLGSDWSYLKLDSYRGGLNWFLSSNQLEVEGWTSSPLMTNSSSDPLWRYSNPQFQNEIKWRWKCCGFDRGQMNFGGAEVTWCRIPFYAATMPFVLLSAWLLLSKPRQSKSKTPIEPIPEPAG